MNMLYTHQNQSYKEAHENTANVTVTTTILSQFPKI